MSVKLHKLIDFGLWIITIDSNALFALGDDDIKSLIKQFKEAGF